MTACIRRIFASSRPFQLEDCVRRQLDPQLRTGSRAAGMNRKLVEEEKERETEGIA